MRLKSFFQVLRTPPAIVLFVSLALIVFNMGLTHRIRPYNSDDVSWQNILLTWRPFSGHKAVLGSSDNFVDKIPFFMLFGHFFGAGRKILFAEASILAVLGFSLFYLSSLYFLKKAKVVLSYRNLLPFVWLASFGHSLSQLYLNPIWRGFEVGISFFVFMLTSKLYADELRPLQSIFTKCVTLLGCLLLGILIYSDPYFLYFTVAPILLFSLVLAALKMIPLRTLSSVLGVALLSLLCAKLTSYVSNAAGIQMATTYPVQFIAFDQLTSSLLQTLHAILLIFGADFFGLNPFSGSAISACINLSLLGFIGFRIYRLAKYGQRKVDLAYAWKLFFGLLGVLAIALFVFSTVASDGINSYRYFIILVLATILFLALELGTLRKGKALAVAVLILAIIFNISVSVRDNHVFALPGATNNNANAANVDIVSAVRSRGLTKGYANYWQAGINSYLSNNRVNFLPIVCQEGKVKEFHWLLDDSRFKDPATQSFFVFDPLLPQTSSCSMEQFIQRFGAPNQTLLVDGRTIFIYNYDVTSRMQ